VLSEVSRHLSEKPFQEDKGNEPAMKIVKEQTECGHSGCPTLYTLDDEGVLVQGYELETSVAEENVMQLSGGETLTRLPMNLLRKWLLVAEE